MVTQTHQFRTRKHIQGEALRPVLLLHTLRGIRLLCDTFDCFYFRSFRGVGGGVMGSLVLDSNANFQGWRWRYTIVEGRGDSYKGGPGGQAALPSPPLGHHASAILSPLAVRSASAIHLPHPRERPSGYAFPLDGRRACFIMPVSVPTPAGVSQDC